ncbi:MAG: response regulator transcription factor [Xanthobacteraceae bacterium]
MAQSFSGAGAASNALRPVSEIFVVDDNEDWREILAAVLELEGYRVTGFSEGQSFLKEAARRTPICVFLDVVMPGPSGLELLRELNETAYAAPIFLVSARADAPVVIEGLSNGARDFIEKPFDPYTAVLLVRDAVDIWTRRAERGIDRAPQSAGSVGDVRLTHREARMLAQFVAGASNAAVAKNLDINKLVVANCRYRIMRKLGAESSADLARIALEKTGYTATEFTANPFQDLMI